ncbi:MAG: phosphoribosylanthranilate isomerase [Methanosarcinaceae archaeon]|nr:phosphoribosylanthranilate isomerase [Methanosarcinaceae archaeon]
MKTATKQVPRVKICGMGSAEDIELAVRCGADAVGFITDVPVDTPRKIDTATATELVSHVPLFVDSVLVIMPDDGEQAVGMIERVKPDVVQLHSGLGADDLEFIRDNTNAGIIKTFSVPVSTTASTTYPADNVVVVEQVVSGINDLIDRDLADGILLDSSKAGKVGGTGAAHDWSISRAIVENVDIPVILAGGLKPGNVRDAVLQVHPYAVDTASGIETDGKKDGAKICRFIKEARCEVYQ